MAFGFITINVLITAYLSHAQRRPSARRCTKLVLYAFSWARKSGLKSSRRKAKMLFQQEVMEYVGASVTGPSQSKDVKPKIGGYKMRSGVYWQGELRQKA